MRCKQCDYPLWNLRSRQCPECGRGFVPSEFDFIINSVRFCCLNCNQEYYGTGERGHLVPPEFTCVKCGQFARMDDMVLLPAAGVREEQTFTDRMPWLDTGERTRGVGAQIAAFFTTMFRAMFDPPRLARSMPAEPRPVRAVVFAFIASTFPMVIGMGLLLLIGFFFAAFGGGGITAAAISLAAWMLVFFAFLFLWAGLTHAVLRLTGPTAGGFARTLEPLCYGTAAHIISIVPCLNFYIWWLGGIWAGVSAVLMLMARQSVGGFRATLAVFTFPAILLVAAVGAYFWYFVPWFQWAQTTARQTVQQATTAAASQGQAALVASGLFAHVDRTGDWPAHAIELVAANDVAASALTVAGRTPADVPAGPMTLQAFTLLPPERERALSQALAESLPANTVAHRLGDYVFTWHGIPAAWGDANSPTIPLWVAVLVPEQETPRPAGPVGAAGEEVVAILLDRSTVSFARSQLPRRLDEQNDMREQVGLAPLPELTAIPHETPATMSDPGQP
jgi:hypothetical protein